jgi:hypothetical protein
MTPHRSCRPAAALVALAAAALLAACGTQAPDATGHCPWYKPGSLSDRSGSCTDRAGGVPFDPAVGRIAMTADGNQNDEDDWASAPMALAIIAHRNLQANLVHYDYNDHIWDSSEKHRKNMTESVQEGGERFGFDMSRFFDDTIPGQLDAGTKDLVAQINSSTSDDELWFVLAGPMETAWMALDGAEPEARKHVKCVSHGEDTFNQTYAKEKHGGHDYDDLIDLGCQRVQIPDQNSGFGPTDMDEWDYLKDSGDDNEEWLYSRLDLVGNGDVSDAGMVYFVVTGDDDGDRSDLKSYFGAGH